MSGLGQQLDELWAAQAPDGWLFEENAGPLAMLRNAPREWESSGPSGQYAWFYYRRGDASALIVKAARDSMLLQSQGGSRRIIIMEQGLARIWVGGMHITLMERDRVWIDRSLYHFIEPLMPNIVFELICWPEVVGLPGESLREPIEPLEWTA